MSSNIKKKDKPDKPLFCFFVFFSCEKKKKKDSLLYCVDFMISSEEKNTLSLEWILLKCFTETRSQTKELRMKENHTQHTHHS